jgi:LCP family protein required for cell wall assembly
LVTADESLEASQNRRLAFEWWWLIWIAAGACVFLSGALLGAVAGGGSAGEDDGFLHLLAPPFGGRDRVTVLAVGVDTSEGRGLADTIIALAVWPARGDLAALSIPRDSRVLVPGVGVMRINASHSYGDRPLTVRTVEMLLGSHFDYYVEVDVPGLVGLVDAVGGLDIEVEKRMYYRDRSQDLLIDLQPGLQHLNGEQAVGYVRFRHDATGDIGRIERQRKFLRVLARELLSPKKVGRIPSLVDAFLETVDTNLAVRDILSLKKLVEQVGPDGVLMETLPGHPRMIDGDSVLELDADQVQRTVDRVLWGQGTRVVVLNATDIKGLAARTAEFLAEQGYDILDVGNADRKTGSTLILDHRGQARRAQRVAGTLGMGVISAVPDGDNPADVTVILGGDFGSATR